MPGTHGRGSRVEGAVPSAGYVGNQVALPLYKADEYTNFL